MTSTFLWIFILCEVSTVLGQSCLFNLTAQIHTQEFSSPGYPDGYENNLDCVWILNSFTESQVEVRFVDLSIEDEVDYIEVLDGAEEDGLVLKNATGESDISNELFISSSGTLRVNFKTDRSDSFRGFRVQYRTALPVKYNITSVIQHQVARTYVISHVVNHDNITRQINFSHILPNDAIISAFRMTSDDVTYEGVIEIRGEALQKYEDNLVLARTTSFISSNRESLRLFSISFNLRPGGEMRFSLQYWTLQIRSQSRYVYRQVVNRLHFVSNICLDVYICAESPIRQLRIPSIASANRLNFVDGPSNIPLGYNVVRNRSYAHISYRHPMAGQQERVPFDGEFQIQYSTDRVFRDSVFYVDGEYFTHVFSPKLTTIPRRIVFVLDTSGSMAGLKIQQLRRAMGNILQRLDNNVFFNVVLFASTTKLWMSDVGLVRATSANIASAEEFIFSIEPVGGTNIDEALMNGLQLLQRGSLDPQLLRRETIHPLLDNMVFLTDGVPSIGMRNPRSIINRVTRSNTQRFGIISIGFGVNVDLSFLRMLSERNGGTWKQIFEDAGAAVQIENFLVGTIFPPILLDFTLTYPKDLIVESTSNNHVVLRKESEFVVTGRLNRTRSLKTGDIIPVLVSGMRTREINNVRFNAEVREITGCDVVSQFDKSENLIERMFALQRVEELLRRLRRTTNPTDRVKIRRQAVNLSLRYSLVTNVTVLVIMEETKEPESEMPPTVSTTTPTPTQRPITDSPLPWIFEGDPHFMIPLKPNLTICFTWGGEPDKVYNLLYDADNAIDVRGRIVSAPPQAPNGNSTITCSTSQPRTYFYEVGFSFLQKNLAFAITPRFITVYNFTNNKRHKTLTVDTSDNLYKEECNGTKIEVYGITKMHSYVNITIQGFVTFTLVLRRIRDQFYPNPTDLREDHIDMDLIGASNFSPHTSGVFGDFSSSKFHRSFRRDRIVLRKNKALLVYRKHRFEVQSTDMSNPLTAHDRVQCWYTCDPEKLIGKSTSEYTKETLLDTMFSSER